MEATSVDKIVEVSSNIFSILSKTDNLNLFLASKTGIRFSNSILVQMGLTRKRFYKAIKNLKDAGLVEKNKGIYVQTVFGRIVYQRNVIEMSEYKSYLQQANLIDNSYENHSITSQDKFVSFFEKVVGLDNISNLMSLEKLRIVTSYEEMVSVILKCVEACKSEILIATRISPDVIIRLILHKRKEGISVKVLADTDLVKGYFKSQNTKKLHSQDKNNDERIKVVGNPWYPDDTIDRRIGKIPFGFIIIDEKDIGIEIIDINYPERFNMGILTRDRNTATFMKKYYQQLWDSAESDILKIKDKLID